MSGNSLIWLLAAVILIVVIAALWLLWRRKHAAPASDNPEDVQALDSAVFSHAIDTLYGSGDRRNRYDIPCVLVCAERPGLAAPILGAAQLEPLEGSGSKGSGWWHNMDGTAFVLPDDAMTASGTGTQSAAAGGAKSSGLLGLNLGGNLATPTGWRTALDLFDQHRSQRALDALVWIIPIDLLDPQAKDVDAVLERLGSAMCQRLYDLQTRLGLQLPLYIQIAGCEQVPGFERFAAALPTELQQQALGWSNPYSLGRTFEKNWVSQGLSENLLDLRRLIAELAVQTDLGDAYGDVYLLPDQLHARLERLPDLLQIALRRNATLESFNLRGVHFTGRPTDPTQAQREADPFAPVAQQAATVAPCFCRDLYARRVFAEFGLANVVRRRLAANRQLYQRVVWGTGTVALIWTIGALISHHFAYQNARNMIAPVALLNGQLNNSSDVIGQDDTIEALHQIDSIEDWSLTSVFMPLSWGGPLAMDSDLQTILRAYHEKVLFQSIDMALHVKANDLVAIKAASDLNAGPPASLDQMPEFVALSSFVDQTVEFERRRKQFLTLIRPNQGTPNDLSDLLIYLFHTQPSARSAQAQREFNEILRNSSYQPKHMRNTAQATHDLSDHLNKLHEAWLNRLFRDNRITEMMKRLESELDRFDHDELVEKEDLIALQKDIGDLRTILTRANLSWMADDTRLSDSYLKLLSKIEQSELIGKNPGANALKTQAMQAQQQFAQTINQQANGDQALLDVSQGKSLQLKADVVELYTALTQLLKHGFVQPGTGFEDATPLQAHQLVAWDSHDLDTAQSLFAQYQEYIAKELPKAPPRFQNALQTIAGTQAGRQIDLSLAHAIASANPNVNWRNSGYDLAQKPLAALIDGLHRIGQDSVARRWEELMRQQSALILTRVDEDLERNAVYQADPHRIATWSGQRPAAITVYGLNSPADLQDYLNHQLEMLSELADGSKTARAWLEHSNAQLPPGMMGVDEWKRVDIELTKYAAKSPTSSAKALEQLIGTDLNDIDIANCHDRLGKLARTRDTDFFQHRAQQLLRQFTTRCQFLQLDRAQAAYNAIRRYYNTRLYNLYPFAARADAPPADPDTVIGFLALLDSELGYARDGLRTWAPGERGPLHFLDQLEAMRPLLGAMLARDTVSGGIVTLELTPEFRINRPREKAGDRIMEWKLDTGATGSGALINLAASSKPPVLTWKLGDPIMMSLRWAKDGDVNPSYDPERFPSTIVEDKAVSWNYPQQWALLHLLADHAVTGSDLDMRESAQPQVLKFVVPTRYLNGVPAGDAIVYARIGISVRGKTDRLAYPRIPTGVAPTLSTGAVVRGDGDNGG